MKHTMEDKLFTINFDTPLDKQADIISKADQLIKLKNCYTTYKKMVRPNVEKFLLYKNNKKLENQQKTTEIIAQIEQQSILDKRQMRIDKQKQIAAKAKKIEAIRN